jgi:hypothetical protein
MRHSLDISVKDCYVRNTIVCGLTITEAVSGLALTSYNRCNLPGKKRLIQINMGNQSNTNIPTHMFNLLPLFLNKINVNNTRIMVRAYFCVLVLVHM